MPSHRRSPQLRGSGRQQGSIPHCTVFQFSVSLEGKVREKRMPFELGSESRYEREVLYYTIDDDAQTLDLLCIGEARSDYRCRFENMD